MRFVFREGPTPVERDGRLAVPTRDDVDALMLTVERLQTEFDAALHLLSPRDCRLCAHFTTNTGGCTSLVQCVDSMQFKATAPRQYWIAGPNVKTHPTLGKQHRST